VRIDDRILDCTVYLYKNAEDALTGVPEGGTGFLVAHPSERGPDSVYIYAVTVGHNVREKGAAAIRLNSKDGDRAVITIKPEEWLHHPDGDDLAVVNLGGLAPDIKFDFLRPHIFLTKELVTELEIGPGDATFMVGRFVGHEGKQNLPNVRFGNISTMPLEPVRIRRGGSSRRVS
jgi:hypothetical protein